MEILTTDSVAYKEIEHIAIVQGNIVLTKHIGQDFMAGLKSIVGGEIYPFTELLKEARTTATERMVKEAQKLEADAIVAVRYSTSQIMDMAAEVMVCGTAVKYKK